MISFFKTLIFFALLAALCWFIGFIWFIGQVPGTSLKQSLSPPKAEIGVVLTGDNGRIIHGLLALYEKKVDTLFISGVNATISDDALFSSLGNDLGIKLYELLKANIVIGRDARSTRGNALESYEFFQKQPQIKSFTLITSNYHVPRALHEFQRVFSEDYTVYLYPAYTEKFPADWWRYKHSSLLMASEYHKFLISYFAQFLAQETQLSEFLANNPL